MATKEVVEELAKDTSVFRRREYGMWKGLLEVCNDKSHPKYREYGGKGIKVTQLWNQTNGSKGYLHFIGDMGFAPDSTAILKRLNPKDDFKPSNCVWVSKQGIYIRNSNGYIQISISVGGIFDNKK